MQTTQFLNGIAHTIKTGNPTAMLSLLNQPENVMKDITNLTGPQLVARYNMLAEQAGVKLVKRFENRATGIARIEKLLAQQTPKKVRKPRRVRRARKTPVDKVDPKLVEFMNNWEGPKIEMIRQLIKANPDCTRIMVRHSAAAAGQNPLTARNNYDKIRKERGEKI